MEIISQYGHAIASLTIYAVVAQILNAVTGIQKGAKGLASGASHAADYSDPAHRLDRAYMNTVEMLAFYAPLVVAAILVGANPFWVNILASSALVLRILANFVYIRGIGANYGGLRTRILIGHSAVNLALAVLVFVAVF